MANYSYIKIAVGSGKATKRARIESFEPVLKRAVLKALDDRWKVDLADWEDDGPTWRVFLPWTALDAREAGQRLQAPGEDVGFPVTLQARSLAFRHSMNMFTNWAQGRVSEELSDFYGHGIFFDSTDRTQRPKTREYRQGKTFQDYLARNYDKPLSAEDQKAIDFWKRLAPEGHW